MLPTCLGHQAPPLPYEAIPSRNRAAFKKLRALLPARNGFAFAPAAGALRTDAGRGGAGRVVANASATSVENASGAAAAARARDRCC